MDGFSVMIVWLAFFSSVSLSWYFYLQARNKERMALIEKNADVSEIFKVRQFKLRFPWMKLGMIFFGMGLGLFLSTILGLNYEPLRNNAVAAMLAIGLMMVFGGGGAVVAVLLERQKD
ncbi:MAG: hypothetical protein LWW85_08950 [Marinilabiliales bacterium]|nr:hypothetical protein [Marinilabiliales bacterium]